MGELRVRDAKQVARRWVLEEAAALPGFCGAFYHGSAVWLDDDALLPATSDLDVMVVLDQGGSGARRGKFRCSGVLLEVSYLPRALLGSPEQVLGQYVLAGSFRSPGIIADPSGLLTGLQAAVARDYARRRWVRTRCDDVRDKVLRYLDSLTESAPLHDQVISWLFATGNLTHVLLVAGLENPTVRRRYVAVRALLEKYGHAELYESLLEPLGCAGLAAERTALHLTRLGKAFDAACVVVKSPFPFAADISQGARPIAIDGSRELIERGDHREAVFWIVASWSRCQKVLHDDAPAECDRFSPGYRELLADLGIASFGDLQRSGERVAGLLPRVCEVAEAIMAANPGIED